MTNNSSMIFLLFICFHMSSLINSAISSALRLMSSFFGVALPALIGVILVLSNLLDCVLFLSIYLEGVPINLSFLKGVPIDLSLFLKGVPIALSLFLIGVLAGVLLILSLNLPLCENLSLFSNSA